MIMTKTEYTVVLENGTVTVEAGSYRQDNNVSTDGSDLYLYADDGNGVGNDPVATFPAGSWNGVYKFDSGYNSIE